jgi:Cof subfamily protein (haloacid dehalogenase superfamily)
MGIRLIALDIDGTLLNSRFEVSPANQAAIVEATRRGIEVAIVTGRRYDFALPVARQIAAPITMIVSNGALVRTNDGTTRLRHLLAKDTARRVIQATKDWRSATAVVFDRPMASQVMLESVDWSDPIRGGYYTRNREYIAEASPLESCLTEDPVQVMFTGQVASMRAAEQLLQSLPYRSSFSLHTTVYESKDFSMIDVLHPAVSKGASLAEWAGLRGVARHEIVAIGDNHNDLEMLSFAGVPVVMGNCVPVLKEQGWHVTCSNDEDGVAAAIDRFVLSEAAEPQNS